MTGNKHGLEDPLRQELQTKYKTTFFVLVLQQMKENLHRKKKKDEEEEPKKVEEEEEEEQFVPQLQEQFQLEKEEQVLLRML